MSVLLGFVGVVRRHLTHFRAVLGACDVRGFPLSPFTKEAHESGVGVRHLPYIRRDVSSVLIHHRRRRLLVARGGRRVLCSSRSVGPIRVAVPGSPTFTIGGVAVELIRQLGVAGIEVIWVGLGVCPNHLVLTFRETFPACTG